MRVRPNLSDSSITYKRLSSKELTNVIEREGNQARLQLQSDMGKEHENPPWGFSFPHVCLASISSFLFGYHLGVVNEPLESIAFDMGFSGNTLVEGLVVSMCLVGAFIGCLFSGWIADGLGRRRALQISAIPMIFGAIFSATATNVMAMLLGRLFVGVGMGLGPPIASLYVTEISPSYVRGTYGSFIQIATCLGLLLSLLITIPTKDTVGWWRVCFWVSILPAAILAISMGFCAESPHWLFKKRRFNEAENEFERLLGGAHIKSAIAELSNFERDDDTVNVRFSDLLHEQNFRVIFIGSMLFTLQQLSGINAVFYFSSTVFRRLGIPSNVGNIFVGLANLTGSIIAMVLMDKLGRKLLLLGSFSTMALAMGLQVAAASIPLSSSESLYLSVGGMLLFVLTFAIGAGPVPGLLLTEILPNHIRAKAISVCMCVHWVVNFFVGLMFLRLLEQLGSQVLYSIFAMVCWVAVIFVKRNVVETKGRSLQDIEIALLSIE